MCRFFAPSIRTHFRSAPGNTKGPLWGQMCIEWAGQNIYHLESRWLIMAPYEAKFRGWRPWDSPKVRPAPGPKCCQWILGAIHRSSNLSAVRQGCHFSGHKKHQRQKTEKRSTIWSRIQKHPKKKHGNWKKEIGPLKPSIPSIKVQGFLPLSHLTWTLTSSTDAVPTFPAPGAAPKSVGPTAWQASWPLENTWDIPWVILLGS